MYDFHIHSDFSIDSKAPMESIVKSAIDKNLKTICFTDHVDFEATKEKLDLMFRPLDYFRDINKVKYKYKDKIEILSGVEIGMQPHLKDRYYDFINAYGFDFVIMSIHSIEGMDIFYDFASSNLSPEETLNIYYDEILNNLRVFDEFDVLGHIDFIDRYTSDFDLNRKYNQFMEKIEEILKLIIDKGKGIEINTGALRYGLDNVHPKPQILKLYKDLGGEIITIGSDAHIADHVGYEYKATEKLLREIGFKYLYLFRERRKFPIQIL